MKRTYLEEDLRLIRKYFPGARTVTVRTPFDLTTRPQPLSRLLLETLHENDGSSASGTPSVEGLLWNH